MSLNATGVVLIGFQVHNGPEVRWAFFLRPHTLSSIAKLKGLCLDFKATNLDCALEAFGA